MDYDQAVVIWFTRIISAICSLLTLACLVWLIHAFWKTRMSAYLWLALALIVTPIALDVARQVARTEFEARIAERLFTSPWHPLTYTDYFRVLVTAVAVVEALVLSQCVYRSLTQLGPRRADAGPDRAQRDRSQHVEALPGASPAAGSPHDPTIDRSRP